MLLFKRSHGSGCSSDLALRNKVEPLEKSRLLIKEISETIKNEAKEQKGGILGILLGTLAASILENALTEKGVIRADEEVIRVVPNVECRLIL